jgi:hypothetical protein
MSVILSSSHYLAVNVAYVLRLLKYRPQLDVSLTHENDPKILACYLLPDLGVSTSSTGDEYIKDFN